MRGPRHQGHEPRRRPRLAQGVTSTAPPPSTSRRLRTYKGQTDAEIAAKNTRLAAHDAESRTGSEEYQRLKTPRAAKKPSRSVAEGE